MSDSAVLGEWGAPVPGTTTIRMVLGAVAICCVMVGLYSLIRRFFKKQQDQGRVDIQLPTLPQSTFEEAAAVRSITFGVAECSVCLEEYAETDMVSVLPGCNHVFHHNCIRDWMVACSQRLSASLPTCPLCRLSYRETV